MLRKVQRSEVIENPSRFVFSGVIQKKTDYSIRVTRGTSKAAFWISIAEFERENGKQNFEEGTKASFTVAIKQTIDNPEKIITTTFKLLDIEKVDNVDDNQSFEFEGLHQSSIKIEEFKACSLINFKIPSTSEVFYLKLSTNEVEPALSQNKYKVTFALELSKYILSANGDCYVMVDKYIRDGQEYETEIYKPCLTIKKLEQI